MLLRLLSLLALSSSFAAAADSAAGGIPNLSGNVGLTGAGYGDAYGGKVSEGVYGAGGRVGGNLGLTGLLGLGRKKRQDFGFVPFSSLNIAAPKPAEPTSAPGGRRKRQATANANATATANGGNASATANAVANAYGKPAPTAAPGRKRRQVFGAMPIIPVNAPGGARPVVALPVPVATAAQPVPAPTTGKPN